MIIPTQTIQRADGKLELLRIASPTIVEPWNPDDPLTYESSLVWLLPIETLDYVRVAVVHHASSRRGPFVLKNDVVLAGYSKLTQDAPVHPRTNGFTRRIFYLKLEDAHRNMNDVPETAIDPATLLPGHAGSAPDIRRLNRAYPRHLRRGRRSVLRKPVSIAPILATHHDLQLAAS